MNESMDLLRQQSVSIPSGMGKRGAFSQSTDIESFEYNFPLEKAPDGRVFLCEEFVYRLRRKIAHRLGHNLQCIDVNHVCFPLD